MIDQTIEIFFHSSWDPKSQLEISTRDIKYLSMIKTKNLQSERNKGGDFPLREIE